MSQTIAILGASGVYARHLIPRLAARGHKVRALVRNPEGATIAAACGAEIRRADIFDDASLREGLSDADVALNLATALRASDYVLNDRVRTEGVPIFLRAAEAAGVKRVLQQTIAMAHGAGGEWADEDTIPRATDNPIAQAANDAALAMERAVRDSGLDWCILAGGLFYGPGTGFDDDWRERARNGKLRLPGDGSDFVSLIHIADMAQATVLAIENWQSRRMLIVTDDEPATWADVYGFVAASVNAPPPQPGGRPGFASFRMRNARAKEALNWAPFYRNYKLGLAL